MWNVDRHLEKFFLRTIIPTLWDILWQLCSFVQKSLCWATNHESALVLELGFAHSHLVPDATQRIVGQEFDDVPRREELVAECEFIGITRSLATPFLRVSRSVPQFLGREILVHPADGFVLRPDVGKCFLIEEAQHIVKYPLRRIKTVRRVIRI